MDDPPRLRNVVVDTTDARRLAEFYRQLLGYEYRPGDEPPARGRPDPAGQDWLTLRPADGHGPGIAFQQVPELPRSTWPGTEVPQQLHLDLQVRTVEGLQEAYERARSLGAELLRDGSDDEAEPIYVLADPDGHPFCIFVVAED